MKSVFLLCAVSAPWMLYAQTAGELTSEEACRKMAETRSQQVCLGVLLNNQAAAFSLAGRMAEAENAAQQSLAILEKYYEPHDLILLRPLQILAGARLTEGKIGKARESLRKMQAMRVERPQDRALVHGISAAVLDAEGNFTDAEHEYQSAIRAWEEAGGGATAEAASVFTGLGSLYIKRSRFDEARQALDRSLTILASASDGVPTDQINVLNMRALLHMKRREWPDAEEKLRRAIGLAEGQHLAGNVFGSLLESYAAVLRKLHRRQEAHSFELCAATVHDQSADAVVDVSELLPKAKRRSRHAK